MGQKQPKLIVISAPSGAGKTTILDRLLEKREDLTRSISYTTRQPRTGEQNGKDYFFVSTEEFDTKKRENFFLESATVFGASYGTPRDDVLRQMKTGKSVVLAIDVQGMTQVRKSVKDKIPMVSIFVVPPSMEVLKDRLSGRKTETQAEIDTRLKIAEHEMVFRHQYDFQVVNEDLNEAVREIEEILK